jgi:arabinofuranan 3-O-arabinosyltransferase
MRTARVPPVATTLARCFVAAAAVGYVVNLLPQLTDQLTDGNGRPFGDDFVNYWSGAWLALHGRAAEVYDIHAFHAFEQSVVGPAVGGYHYSYPPVMLLLSAPFALIPYVPALFVWLGASWYAFYRVLKHFMPDGGAFLFALATPAVLVNAVGGQNGAWTAAFLGGGVSLLERRPWLAGVPFGLMIYKPHLAILLPVALAAGRKWRTFLSTGATAAVLLGASVAWFGTNLWALYFRNVEVLRHVILESNVVVNRMVSVFVAVHPLGASIAASYLVQAAFGLVACVAVALVWFRDAPAGVRYAVLLLGTCLATPYLQDYDLVFGALVLAWLWRQPVELYSSEHALLAASALFLILPLVASALARATLLTYGPLFILPLFVVAVRAGLAARESERATPVQVAATR